MGVTAHRLTEREQRERRTRIAEETERKREIAAEKGARSALREAGIRPAAVDRHGIAFSRYLRSGGKVTEAERRDLTEGVGSQGGYLVPPDFGDAILMATRFASGLWAHSRVWNSNSGAPANFPIANDTTIASASTPEATVLGETDIAGLSHVAFPQAPLWTLGNPGLIKASRALAADSAFPLEEVLSDVFARRLARGTDAAWMPALVAAATNITTSAGNAAITYGDLAATFYSLDLAYRGSQNAAWIVNKGTALALRDIADTSGRPVLVDQPSVDAVSGSDVDGDMIRTSTLFGLPVYESASVATIGAAGTQNKVAILADLSRAHIIRVAGQPSIQALQERYSDTGEIGYIGFARVDALPAALDALAVLQMHS